MVDVFYYCFSSLQIVVNLSDGCSENAIFRRAGFEYLSITYIAQSLLFLFRILRFV